MIKKFLTLRKRVIHYFRNHVEINAIVHVIAGIGLGILIASPLAFPHPVRWAVILVAISFCGHLYALFAKK